MIILKILFGRIVLMFLLFLQQMRIWKDALRIKYYTLSTLYYLRRNDKKRRKLKKRIIKLKPIFFRDYIRMTDEEKKAEKKTKVD